MIGLRSRPPRIIICLIVLHLVPLIQASRRGLNRAADGKVHVQASGAAGFLRQHAPAQPTAWTPSRQKIQRQGGKTFNLNDNSKNLLSVGKSIQWSDNSNWTSGGNTYNGVDKNNISDWLSEWEKLQEKGKENGSQEKKKEKEIQDKGSDGGSDGYTKKFIDFFKQKLYNMLPYTG